MSDLVACNSDIVSMTVHITTRAERLRELMHYQFDRYKPLAVFNKTEDPFDPRQGHAFAV
jgi:hypothetical protein